MKNENSEFKEQGRSAENLQESDKKPQLTLSNLSPARGSNHRPKIVGRGIGSGHGRHATRGMKGQRSRSGDTKMIGFEGGQMTLLRRIPKRGFTPPFPKQFSVVNLQDLDQIFKSDSEVNPVILKEQGLVKKELPVKILGAGKITKPLKISAQAFSKQAKDKIVAAGGTVQLLS